MSDIFINPNFRFSRLFILQFNLNASFHLHFLTLFLVLIAFASHYPISANTIHRNDDYLSSRPFTTDNQATVYVKPDSDSDIDSYPAIDSEPIVSNIWSPLYRQKSSGTSYMPAMPHFQLRSGIIRLVSDKKRTIPLELQKALYAHGIVGRRR
jgi:hypothetical protein